MSNVGHPQKIWPPTGAPFFEPNGRMRELRMFDHVPEGQDVFEDATRPEPIGSLVCCHVNSGAGLERLVWTVLDCRKKEWGPGVATYDILVVPAPDFVCPLCLLRDVMES